MKNSLTDILRLAGINEADYKVKDKTDLDIDWDNVFDEPENHAVAHSTVKPEKVQPEKEKTLKKAGSDRTRQATANITPTDAMRDMLSRLDRNKLDATDNETPEPVTTQNLPAVINTAIARAPGKDLAGTGTVTPDWHAVADLPGNMDRAILRLGKQLFGAFTKTPTKDIVMIGNLGGQGPNSELEVRSVAKWIVDNGRRVDIADIDFSEIMPGYKAQIQQFVAAGIRFELVKDFAGTYIYAWPESDSIDATTSIGTTNTDTKRLK